MKHLLDVNVLLARLVRGHQDQRRVANWLSAHPEVVLCPLTELGFLRISTLPRFGFPMADARRALDSFAKRRNVERIADDLEALDSHPQTSGQVTDHYLADLADKHGLKLATLDGHLQHPAAVLVT